MIARLRSWWRRRRQGGHDHDLRDEAGRFNDLVMACPACVAMHRSPLVQWRCADEAAHLSWYYRLAPVPWISCAVWTLDGEQCGARARMVRPVVYEYTTAERYGSRRQRRRAQAQRAADEKTDAAAARLAELRTWRKGRKQ